MAMQFVQRVSEVLKSLLWMWLRWSELARMSINPAEESSLSATNDYLAEHRADGALLVNTPDCLAQHVGD